MQVELRQLFFDAAIAFATAEGLEIAVPNVDFDPLALPETAKHYLSATVLPVPPNVYGVEGEASNRFILQISIYTRKGIGEIKPLAIADKLRKDAFRVTSEFVGANHSFKVIRPPAPAPAVPLDAWYSTPVRFTVETLH